MIRTLYANYLSTFHLPPAPFHLVRPLGLGLLVLVGIGRGLRITTEDDASSPIRLNQRREAKERRVRRCFVLFHDQGSPEKESNQIF